MKLIQILFLSAAMASPVAAQDHLSCDEAWYLRNLIYDRSGHCFTSPLGQAVFDNTGCSAAPMSLPDGEAETVAQIVTLEADWNCAVDTGRTMLPDIATYRSLYDDLEDLPVPSAMAGGCIGYRGARVALHAGQGEDSPVIGQITPGQSFGLSHAPAGDWIFITVHPRDDGQTLSSHGWTFWDPVALMNCEVQPG